MESDSDISVNSDAEQATTDEVIEGNFDVTSSGKLVKRKDRQPPYTKREMVIIWQYLKGRYEELYGESKGANYSYSTSEIWKEFAVAVNAAEDGKNERTVKRVWKRIDNMKYKGKLKCGTPGCAMVVSI